MRREAVAVAARWIVLLGTLSVSAAASAAVQWSSADGGNDHLYELVLEPDGISWDAAKTAAESTGGYLATITSAAENEFVFDLAKAVPSAWFRDATQNGQGPWLGGFQADGATEPSGGWRWVTGEAFDYTNWASFEPSDGAPNNPAGSESRLQLFGLGTLIGDQWNDLPPAPYANVKAYIVETPVPEPASVALLLCGLAALGGVAWFRRWAAILVSQSEPLVEVYRRTEAGRWELLEGRPGDLIELRSLGISLDIAALYADPLARPA